MSLPSYASADRTTSDEETPHYSSPHCLIDIEPSHFPLCGNISSKTRNTPYRSRSRHNLVSTNYELII